ncbi:hypothetical protein [Avibacterium endocarditidis]|nr:hypothetical protein [Avibacterium endocarditidis]
MSKQTVKLYKRSVFGGFMLNKKSRFILTISGVAPVCATVGLLAFIGGNKNGWNIIQHFKDFQFTKEELLFVVSVFLLIVSISLFPLVLRQAKKEERWHSPNEIKISSLTPANGEITNYFLGYLFPLLGGGELFNNIYISIFFYISMFIWVSFSGAYSLNPIFTFLGYKFYEAEKETETGKTIGFILIAKGIISSPELPYKNGKANRAHLFTS